MKYRGIKYQTYVAVTTFCCTMLCASLNCERKSKENYLEDCQWSKVDKCIDCPVGYYGINCSRPCRYPNYGINCQYDCSSCGQETCSSTFGCMTIGKQPLSSTNCPDGFYGINCSRQCRYPNYGIKIVNRIVHIVTGKCVIQPLGV
ncbi:cell death abnormality protein 1-like [Crassostrea angulata]|uniref:cell death abnormality protein 1-like n=1 Tax=Magallana angulata TaxID=2784310 RepID=UPI0022B11D16|nr:cell death abnormality protein 1-like [Crassostrea angulata]